MLDMCIKLSSFNAGIKIPPMVIDNVKLPTFVQDFCGYAIEGEMPYANTDDIVLCITGDGKIINALFSIFRAEHSSLPYEFERRQLYLAAEGASAKLGYIAKSPVADPNDVMPFFEKWGINLQWSKTQWVARNADRS